MVGSLIVIPKFQNDNWLKKVKISTVIDLQIKEKFWSPVEVINFWFQKQHLRDDFKRLYNTLMYEYIPISKKNNPSFFFNYKKFKQWYLINTYKTYIVDVETPTAKDIPFLKESNQAPYGTPFIVMEKYHNSNNDYNVYNYYEWYVFLDSIDKRCKFETFNLTYDSKYYARPLVEELGYELLQFTEDSPTLKIKDMPDKSVYIFTATDTDKNFYMIIKNSKGITLKFECAYLKLMNKVEELGKDLYKRTKNPAHLKKEYDYGIRAKDYVLNEKERSYVFSDVLIVKDFLLMIEDEYYKKTGDKFIWDHTISGTAHKMIKKYFRTGDRDKKGNHINKWGKYFSSKLTYDEWKWLNSSYNGGFTMYNFRYLGRTLPSVKVIDINSAHPHKMSDMEMPYGYPIYNCMDFNCKNNHFSFYEIFTKDTIKVKKNWDGINFIQIQYGALNEYFPYMLRYSKINVSSVGLNIFLETFDISNKNVEITRKFCFYKKRFKQFTDFVSYWYDIKNQNRDNLAMYYLSKLILNSVYGKFGQKSFLDVSFYDLDWEKETLENVKEVDENKIYFIPLAIAIADYTRLQLVDAIKKIGAKNFVYSDTDSIFYLPDVDVYKVGIDVDNVKLGFFSSPTTYYNFKLVGKKKYIYTDILGDVFIKCAGLPDKAKKQIKQSDFKVGFSIGGKTQKTSYKGMPLLGETKYTIKNVIKTFLLTLKKDIKYIPDHWKELISVIEKDYFIDKDLKYIIKDSEIDYGNSIMPKNLY